MKLSLIIPIYNEEATLSDLLDLVLEAGFPEDTEVLLVNDGSKDKSQEIIDSYVVKHPNFRSLENEQNMGKTQTVAKGLRESKGDYVAIQDADLEYDPKDLVGMHVLAQKDGYDVVYGNRFGKKNDVIYWKNYIGNRSLSVFSNIFTYPRLRVFIPDMEVCYKLIRGDVARELGQNIVSTTNFGFEPEVTAKLSRYKIDGKHLSFQIVPISYLPRSIEEGKKMNAFKDGFKALGEILKFNLEY